MKFYDDDPDMALLRFGDIVDGLEHVYAQINELHFGNKPTDWSIAIAKPQYITIMTPCCSIEDESVLVAPLLPLTTNIFNNSYFREDPTRLNGPVTPIQSVGEELWTKLPQPRKDQLLSVGPGFVFNSLFIYDKHDILENYELNTKSLGKFKTNYYMVDFKRVCRIQTPLIDRKKIIPEGMKRMQLSINARTQLRNKCSDFFARVPDEDQVDETI